MARRTLRSLLGLGPASPEPAWALLTNAANEPEAELLVQLVAQEGIPVYFQRPPGHDPLFIAGMCELLVPEERLAEARELLESLEAVNDETPAPTYPPARRRRQA
jgi:hypothetical protein